MFTQAKRGTAAQVLLLSAEAQFGSGGSPQPPLCKGGTAWQGHAGGIVKPVALFGLVL